MLGCLHSAIFSNLHWSDNTCMNVYVATVYVTTQTHIATVQEESNFKKPVQSLLMPSTTNECIINC